VRTALDHEFVVDFQPIVDLGSGEVVSAEALARWQTDTGIREPYEFLPGIERAGLNASLFHRMLDDGLTHLATFRSVLAPAGTLATQDCQLVAERNDLELQFRAAAKPTSEP